MKKLQFKWVRTPQEVVEFVSGLPHKRDLMAVVPSDGVGTVGYTIFFWEDRKREDVVAGSGVVVAAILKMVDEMVSAAVSADETTEGTVRLIHRITTSIEKGDWTKHLGSPPDELPNGTTPRAHLTALHQMVANKMDAPVGRVYEILPDGTHQLTLSYGHKSVETRLGKDGQYFIHLGGSWTPVVKVFEAVRLVAQALKPLNVR